MNVVKKVMNADAYSFLLVDDNLRKNLNTAITKILVMFKARDNVGLNYA